MATWFAQTNAANINAANMWNSIPAGGGTVLTWPPASGDVLVANGKTVVVNVSTNLGSAGEIRNDTTGGATAGGHFSALTGISVTANIPVAGASAVVFQFNNTGTVSLIGNITHANGNQFCVLNGNTGTLNITGSVTSEATGSLSGIRNALGGTVNIVGNILNNGTQGGGNVVSNTGAGVVNITGSVTNSSSINSSTCQNFGAGTINVTGNAIHNGTTTRGCVLNSSTGTATVSGFAESSSVGPGIENSAQGIIQVGETRSASNGRGAVLGAFRYASATAAKDMPYTPDGQISMTVLDVAAIVPAESDVRKGLVYGDGAYTGTLPLGRNRTIMAGRF